MMENMLRRLFEGDDHYKAEEEDNTTYINLIKVGSLVIILVVTLLFGYFPLIW